MARWGVLAVCVVMAACEPSVWRPPSELDTHDDPNKLRPGYGNDALHMWWPLTSAEMAAVQGIEKARQGDANALLALALLGSGDKRDAESYTRYAQRVSRFVDDARPMMVSAQDDWHRGDTLNRTMHHMLLTGSRNPKDPEIGAYELDQARLTGVFDSGHYNCISSALLYTVLAREFSLPVRGVITTTHAFVELDPEGTDKHIDVETTSEDGFDKVHDEHYYAEQAKKWSDTRGLKPMTFDEYKKREIVSAFEFVARAMNDKRNVNDDTQGRLFEVAATMVPDNYDLVYNRMVSYTNEAKWLRDHKAARTVLRLIEVVAPAVSDVASRWSTNKKLMSLAVWLAWFNADALEITGRGDEAVAIADDAFDRVDATWEDSTQLKNNFVNVLLNHMTELQTQGNYEKSLSVILKHLDACRSNDACLNNLYLTFDGWCAQRQRAGDKDGARKVLERCIAVMTGDRRCHTALETLSGR